MKKRIGFTMLSILLCVSNAVMAQVTVTIGSPPPWGPVGYAGVRYYYLPDVECYYDIESSKFIYYQPTGWVYASRLPYRHRNYDLFNGYKIVMTGYRGTTPYDHFSDHKRDFKKGSNQGESQKTNAERSGNSKDKDGANKGRKNH